MPKYARCWYTWKHSQYFFKHMDLRQRQPILCATLELDAYINKTNLRQRKHTALNLLSNAFGFRSKMLFTASSLSFTLFTVFKQARQLHVAVQVILAAKHWQYLRKWVNVGIFELHYIQFQTSWLPAVAHSALIDGIRITRLMILAL